jgi:Tol biopolymer transport system component
MGEVYRARDPRLARDVAIKVLPAHSSTDGERLRRFELEAKAVGALNHPNLLAVFDTGRHEAGPFVVFELLDGATLRTRLAGKPLAPRHALDYAIQIARGLAAAHDKGIVHRDLKPENLFVTRDGRVKILDFGLAKLRPPLDPGALDADTPTASAMTDAGSILGTVGYMSPEQVRRSPVDHRSDIFSFGSVLYEMLVGKRAFQGETEAETMTAILKADPPSLGETDAKVPVAFERVVRHCLEKRPEDRFQSARDLVFDLESLAPASGVVVPDGRGVSRCRRLLALVGTGVLGMAIGLGGALLERPRSTESPVFEQVTFRRGVIAEARFAPDGQTIVYGAAVEGHHNRLFSARLGSAEVRALDLPEGDIAGITASGEMAVILEKSYLSRQPGTLARVSLAGGAPRELLKDVSMAAWGPDGKSLAVIRHDGPKPRLEFPIGKELYVSETGIVNPRVSPRGDRIAFAESRKDGDDIRVVDLGGRVSTLATADAAGLAWSPSGDEVWFGGWGILRAVTLSGAQRALTRFPGPITINDVFHDGRVLVTTAQWYNPLMFAGPGDIKERDLAWFERALPIALSQDGTTLLFSDRGRGRGSPDPGHAYLRRTDGSPAVRLGEGFPLSLSPDGKWAMSMPDGAPLRCILLPTGPGESRPLPLDDLECLGASWFPDGKQLLVAGKEPAHSVRLFVQDTEGGGRRPITPEGFNLDNPYTGVSPDGKLVLAADASGQLAIFPREGGEPRMVPGIQPFESSAGWGADSQSLYVYRREADLPVKVARLDLRTGRREPFKTLSPPDVAAFGGIFNVMVTPDGKAYTYGYWRIPCILYVIEGLR